MKYFLIAALAFTLAACDNAERLEVNDLEEAAKICFDNDGVAYVLVSTNHNSGSTFSSTVQVICNDGIRGSYVLRRSIPNVGNIINREG